MIILQINYYLRIIEKVYRDVSFIDQNEYEIEKVIQCCKGEIYSYGGRFSENGIWRFVKDLPYLKGNFDFNDSNIFGFKLAIPCNDNYDINNMIQYTYLNNSIKNEEIEIDLNNNIEKQKSKNLMNKVKKNSLFHDNENYFKNAIAQIKNDKIIMIYPDINFIPDWIYDRSYIKYILYKNIEYKGYNWVKYSLIHEFLNRNINLV